MNIREMEEGVVMIACIYTSTCQSTLFALFLLSGCDI